MNFKHFESLAKEEAQKYLDDFLDFGKNRGIEILEEILHFTVDLDYSFESLSVVLKMLLPVMKTIPREPDLKLPEFIRNTESYKQNLFDSDEPSKSIVLASAYYWVKLLYETIRLFLGLLETRNMPREICQL